MEFNEHSNLCGIAGRIQGFIFDRQGNLIICETNKPIIYKITIDGKLITIRISDNISFYRISFSAKKRMFYLSSAFSGEIAMISEEEFDQIFGDCLIKPRYLTNKHNYGYKDGNLDIALFSSAIMATKYCNRKDSLFLTDRHNHCIREIDLTNNTVSTFCGDTISGTEDGYYQNARFSEPHDLVFDNSELNLFVTDYHNKFIRKVNLLSGYVSTLICKNIIPNHINQMQTGDIVIDSIPKPALFLDPTGITCDLFNNLYLCDTRNHSIKKINPLGEVSIICYLKNDIHKHDSCYPTNIIINDKGELYFSTWTENIIYKVNGTQLFVKSAIKKIIPIMRMLISSKVIKKSTRKRYLVTQICRTISTNKMLTLHMDKLCDFMINNKLSGINSLLNFFTTINL